jgi:hypothetical protein
MSAMTRRAISLSVLWLGAFWFLALDMHRTLIRTVWPYLESFYFTNIAF